MNESREMGGKVEEGKGEVFIKMRITRACLCAAENDPPIRGIGDEEKSAYNERANLKNRQDSGRVGFREVGRQRTGTVADRCMEMQTAVFEKP